MAKKATLAFAISSIFFILCAALVTSGKFDRVNAAASAAAQSLEAPRLTAILIFVTNTVSFQVFVPLAAILLVLTSTRRAAGAPAAIILTFSQWLNELLKRFFAIPRPSAHRLIELGGYGFPSGHAMTGTAFIGFCALSAAANSRSKALKIVLPVLAAAYLIVIGFSRVYLGVHDISQVLAGYAAGAALCSLAFMIKL